MLFVLLAGKGKIKSDFEFLKTIFLQKFSEKIRLVSPNSACYLFLMLSEFNVKLDQKPDFDQFLKKSEKFVFFFEFYFKRPLSITIVFMSI